MQFFVYKYVRPDELVFIAGPMSIEHAGDMILGNPFQYVIFPTPEIEMPKSERIIINATEIIEASKLFDQYLIKDETGPYWHYADGWNDRRVAEYIPHQRLDAMRIAKLRHRLGKLLPPAETFFNRLVAAHNELAKYVNRPDLVVNRKKGEEQAGE